jgi:UDP-N-acetyl-2-amino-2-deoxyglucuronate dehydrogenase
MKSVRATVPGNWSGKTMTPVGIIGGGGISETHAHAAREVEAVEIAACFGRNPEKVGRLSSLYGGTAYADFNDFLRHKPMDLVMIGSPSGLHGKQGIAAARQGLHVLVEKPIDVSTVVADELITECERAGVKLGVFFQDRCAPDVSRLKGLVNAGRLGKPILASAKVNWYRPPEYYSRSDWRGSPALAGGGALINQAIHTVDLLLWLMGDVTKVYAKATASLHPIEVEDTVVATLEFVNGAMGTLEATTSVYPGYARRIELTGSEGTIVLERDRIIRADLLTPFALEPVAENKNSSASSPIVSDVSGHKKILEDFLYAIATGGTPLCDGHEGRRSLELVEAIYESARKGSPVTLRR